MKIEYLTRSHLLDAIDNRAPTVVGTLDMMLRAIDVYTMPKHGLAYMENGKIYAVAGVFPLWEGSGEAWAIPTKDIANRRISIARHFRRTLDLAFEDLKMRRVQAAVKVGHINAHKLARFLGMEEEGLMKRYGPEGADYVRYAIWPTQ
mgnify:CR=1 FL=1